MNWKQILISTALLGLGVLFSACYSFHDKGINAYQAGANPEQGVLNNLNHQGTYEHESPDRAEGVTE